MFYLGGMKKRTPTISPQAQKMADGIAQNAGRPAIDIIAERIDRDPYLVKRYLRKGKFPARHFFTIRRLCYDLKAPFSEDLFNPEN